MGGTLWLCYFPSSSCISVPYRKLSLTHHHQLLQPPILALRQTLFHVRASSATNKSRRSRRRVKSDAEIRNDICQFLLDVGLPDDHIPSTKELLHHGRNDLANIVRRRGYKMIRELLTSSSNADIDALNTEKSLDEKLDAADDREDLLTGQDVKVDSMVDDVATSTKVPLGYNYSSLDTDSTPSLDECTTISVEHSANSSMKDESGELKDHDEEANNVAEGNFHPTEAAIVDNDCSSSSSGSYPNFDNESCISTEISGESSFETKSFGNPECEDSKMIGDINFPSAVPFVENHSNASFNDSDIETGDKEFNSLESSIDFSFEQKDRFTLEGLDESNSSIAEDVPSTSGVSTMENLSGGNNVDSIVHSTDSCINLDSSANSSLEEKVAKFIQSGDLDPVEDHVSGISSGDDYEEINRYIESKSNVDMPQSVHPPEDNNATALNGSSLTSKQVVPSTTSDHLLQDDHMPHEDQTTYFDKDLDYEAPKMQNQSEINHLKFMLYQKELELSQLKEQIEKEKLALSVLQTKAEAEISKARKLVSEKDAELHVAEESLSGLKEVQIEFCGDGDVVEVAGSFNGWHHRIKMDPQSSPSVLDPAGSRRSRFWSTVLWLYPGKYEIKFVVDGHWRIDPQMESVTRGYICNNILRVDR